MPVHQDTGPMLDQELQLQISFVPDPAHALRDAQPAQPAREQVLRAEAVGEEAELGERLGGDGGVEHERVLGQGLREAVERTGITFAKVLKNKLRRRRGRSREGGGSSHVGVPSAVRR